MPINASQKAQLVLLQKRITAAKAVVKTKRDALSAFIKTTNASKPKGLQAQMQVERTKNSKRQDIFRSKMELEGLQLTYQTTKKRFYGH